MALVVLFVYHYSFAQSKFIQSCSARAIFNEAQIELLNVMATINSDDELNALKHVISEFFARRADEEMEKLWQSGEWNPQTLEDLKTASPY